MIVKKTKSTFIAKPFARILLKGISLIILIFTSTENIYGNTSIIGIDLIEESLPKSILYSPILIDKDINKDIKIKKWPIFFYLIFSKNLYFKYNEKRITIKLFSRKIGYRASYSYKRENLDSHSIKVNDLKITKLLELTHEHVYDLLSISYGSKKYRINKSEKYRINEADIECYHYFNIGFSINFPGEFYEKYICIPPINVKSIRDFFTKPPHSATTFHHTEKETYEYYFVQNFTKECNFTKDYYSAIFSLTNIRQWMINILIGQLENNFIEYTIEKHNFFFLAIYKIPILISIGQIIHTITLLYKHIKKDDDNKNIKNDDDNKNIKNDDDNKNIKNDDEIGLLNSFYFLFFLNSICVFKINL